MNVFVLGSGGREHVIAWKLRQSPLVQRLFVAPGNAGIGQIAQLVPLTLNDHAGILRFVQENAIDLTIVGPEQPLVQGIVDLFESHHLKIFGPSKAAAALEGSKVFAKEFMAMFHIPTARFAIFTNNQRSDAEAYIRSHQVPCVVKADGLAAGKGVLICSTQDEACVAIEDLMVRKIFGTAGERVVIEEYMAGEEASVFAITDGVRFTTLAAAQDHKRIFDNDMGKNTGGMGAYAPAPIVTPELMKRIEEEVIAPTLKGMQELGTPYKGCLYCGLMITDGSPKVVEYNCRFGDPEAQVVIPLIDADFAQLLLSAAEGRLNGQPVPLHDASAVCVVMASRGYPDDYETGKEIIGLESAKPEEGVAIFHSGTRSAGERVETSGGRVLGVTAIGYAADLPQTIETAYRVVGKVTFDGAYYRSDIGKKALKHLTPKQ
ncbi:MAG: phosphoribosylamine--glycine ligase [bacterium]